MDFTYDQVPYPCLPLSQTHPDRLATIARLFGLAAAPPDGCRVLELGSGDGGNLIPMALTLPESEFTGIDLAEQAVARGCGNIHALGLRNIALRHLDLMAAGADLGEFDYIIAHGLYSWVPAEVRDHLISICRANLAPQGVAYVSYNAYPGYHRREMFREMMLHHVRNLEDPASRVQQAVQFIDWLSKYQPEGGPARTLFQEASKRLSEAPPWYLYHDDLETTNYALYFHEFMAHARRHQLQYLAEADFVEMQDDIYPELVTAALRRFAGTDVVAKEQYLDFMKSRLFRETLLCREEAVLDRHFRPERIMELYIASSARPVSGEPGPRSGVLEEFRGPRGSALKTDYPPAKEALRRLGEEWPKSLRFPDLLGNAGADAAAPLAEILLQAHRAGLLEVYTLPPPFAAIAGERPVSSPLARLQAQQTTVVTTLRHTTDELQDLTDRCVLLLLDGTRNREALLEGVPNLLRSVEKKSGAFTAESLEARLTRLAKQALLLR